MVLAMLKNTTNQKFANLIGRTGELEERDGLFHFHFGEEGKKQDLNSRIVSQLGSLEHPRSEEVVYRTNHSEYVFKKLQNVSGGCFDYVK